MIGFLDEFKTSGGIKEMGDLFPSGDALYASCLYVRFICGWFEFCDVLPKALIFKLCCAFLFHYCSF